MINALLATSLALVLDFTWARLAAARESGRVLHAVAWNAALDLTGTCAIWLVVDDRWLIIPGILGGAAGLAWGMSVGKKKGPSGEPPGPS